MTIKTRTVTSSLAALILAALLMACPGPQVDPTLCNGTSKTADISLEGATVQAEDYSSATTGVERRQASGGPCSLRTTSKESSGEYTLKIAQASDFDVTFNVNANAGAKLRLELDGNPMDNTDLTATATANTFKDFILPALTLPAGEHKLRIVVADLNGSSAVMIDSFKLKRPSANLPYSGTLPDVPPAPEKLVLEAEQFDRGGEGPALAYHDTTPGNSGTGTRISNVDIDIQGNDQFVTDTQPGEYLNYSFNVPATLANKYFKVTVRYASVQAGGQFSLTLGGRILINKATVLASGSNTGWREESVVVPLGTGTREFQLYFDSLVPGAQSVMNVDRIQVSVDSTVPPDPPPTEPNGVIGQVSPIYQWGDLMPIHAALMPNGKVFAWGGGNDYNNDTNLTVWDPAQGEGPDARSKIYYTNGNLFCAGFSHLPDGKLLIAGGHWDNFIGVPNANIFDSAAQTLAPTTSMYAEKLTNAVGNPRKDSTFDPTKYYKDPTHTGRWYPSTTPLANGEIMVSEGYSSIKLITNNLPEVWDGGGWRTLDNAVVTDVGALSYYPFMYPRPNGEVVRIGPEATMYAFTTNGTGAVRKLNKRPDNITRDYGSAAMFAPGKILLVGGNGGDGAGSNPLNTGVVVDINSNTPTFTTTANMAYGRRHLSTTVLPTGDVLISGGSSGQGHNKAPYAVAMELYKVATNSFKTLANINTGRGYHSIALLLPDGRIMIGGGGSCGGCQTNGDQNNVEYFKPPYLFKSDGGTGQIEVTSRPEISTVTNTSGTPIDLNTSIGYGQNLKIATTGKIARVTMIKLGAVTHARNFDQNFNQLDKVSNTFDAGSNTSSLTMTTPSEPAWATPGHYMIFAIDTDGVPSVAKIIKLQ
jgi:Domain of unknown function (DUF1929)/Carbohydrate binding module (family 6)